MCNWGGGNTTTTNTNQNYKPHRPIWEPGRWALNNAWQLAQHPMAIPKREIAGFTPMQMQAFDAIKNSYNIAGPAYAKAGRYADSSADPITRGEINHYLNPWADYALAGLNEDIGVQTRDLSGNLAQAAGGVGADRIAVGLAEKSRTDQLARGQLMSDFFNKALGAAQGDKSREANAGNMWMNIGTGGQNAALAGANALYGAGSAGQGLQQARNDAGYAWSLANKEAPWKATQYLANIVGGLAPAMGGKTQSTQTNTYPEPSPWGAIAGLGSIAMGLPGSSVMGAGGWGGLMNSMFGQAMPGTGYTGPSMMAYGAAPQSIWYGGQQFPMYPAARGGRVDEPDEYADGGSVNPFALPGMLPPSGTSVPDWAQAMIGFDPIQTPPMLPPSNTMPDWTRRDPGSVQQPGATAGFPIVDGNNEPPPLPPTRPPASSNPYSIMADPLTTPKVLPPEVPITAPQAAQPAVAPAGTVVPPAARPPAATVPPAPTLADFMPRKPRTGNMSDRLLEAGLTMLANYGARDSRGLPTPPLATIGKGGLAALEGRRKDIEEDRKDITLEQRAKDLLDDAQKWRANLAETSRFHDLTSDWRSTKSNTANFIRTNHTEPDGRKGVLYFDKKSGERFFREGERIEGSFTSVERRLEDLRKEYGISAEGAYRIMRMPGTEDKQRLALEAEARRLAEAATKNSIGAVDPETFNKAWRHYRRQKGLPDLPLISDEYE